MYCDLKAVGGWALYCNTMHSQDATWRWARGRGACARHGPGRTRGALRRARGERRQTRGAAGGRAGSAGWAQARGLCAPGCAAGPAGCALGAFSLFLTQFDLVLFMSQFLDTVHEPGS